MIKKTQFHINHSTQPIPVVNVKKETEKELVGITQNHLNAITCILYFYDRHLWNFMAPSPKRTRQILEVQLLLVKIQLLATSKIGTLTPAEVGYIESAIKVFTAQANQRTIPPLIPLVGVPSLSTTKGRLSGNRNMERVQPMWQA
jgi:hypothetical protein